MAMPFTLLRQRNFYLVLCVVGVLLPYWQFVPWFLDHGLDISLFVQQLFANRIGAFFGLDVLVSSVVLWIFIFAEGRASWYATTLGPGYRQSSGGRIAWVAAFPLHTPTSPR
jgi:Protein of unknown function DUF2834